MCAGKQNNILFTCNTTLTHGCNKSKTVLRKHSTLKCLAPRTDYFNMPPEGELDQDKAMCGERNDFLSCMKNDRTIGDGARTKNWRLEGWRRDKLEAFCDRQSRSSVCRWSWNISSVKWLQLLEISEPSKPARAVGELTPIHLVKSNSSNAVLWTQRNVTCINAPSNRSLHACTWLDVQSSTCCGGLSVTKS